MGNELEEVHKALGSHEQALKDIGDDVNSLKEVIPEIHAHIEREDAHKEAFESSFARGEERMDKIEQDLAVISKLVGVFEGFTRSFKTISYLAGAVMALFLWILLEKNNDIKNTQETLLKHTVTLERLVVSHGELERDFRREIEGIHGRSKGR